MLPCSRRPARLVPSRALLSVLTRVLEAKANIVPICLGTLGPLRPSRWVKSAPLLGCWGQWVRGSGSRFKVAESLPLASRGGPAATGPGGLPVGQDSGAELWWLAVPGRSPGAGDGPKPGSGRRGRGLRRRTSGSAVSSPALGSRHGVTTVGAVPLALSASESHLSCGGGVTCVQV